MAFELDAREYVMAFPCSICKKKTQPANVCRDTCDLHDLSIMETDNLKNDVQKLIEGRLQHPKKN